MEKTISKENKMGTMPVNKLLLSMSLPMMLSMMVQALYNVVDSIFVSRVSEDALTAVSLAFPIQFLIIAFGGGSSVGINALLSKALGSRDKETVDKAANNGVFMMVIGYILTLLMGIFVVKPFYFSQTDAEVIVKYGVDYLSIVCIFSFGMMMQMVMERLLVSTGQTMLSMITQSVGAIINIILDPILIFGLFGAPRLETAGAAWATIIGQFAAGLLAYVFNKKFNHEITLSIKGFKPDPGIIKQIYKVGIPAIIMQSIGSIMVYFMNKILIGFSSTANAVFGVYFKLQSFIFMPVVGLNNGMIPIVAFNYGAGKKRRMLDTIKLGIGYAFLIMGIGLIVFESMPGRLFALFNASENMLGMGTVALRIIAIHFPIAAISIILCGAFQALGNGVYSMINSIMRQLVALLPAAYLLSLSGNVNNVWWAFPIAEVISIMVVLVLFVRIKRNVIDKLHE